jgi:heme A synthase
MVFELILGAVLIAFGVMSIYFSIEQKLNDKNLVFILILGLVSVIIGGWIFASKLTLDFVLRKIGGIILTLFGAFMVLGFPDINDYQKDGMSKAGILFGIIIGILGLWLLLT